MSNVRGGNLVKSFFLARDGIEPRVIDTNSIVEEKINNQRYANPQPAYDQGNDEGSYNYEEGFSDGLDAQTLDALVGDTAVYGEPMYDENGEPVSNVIKGEMPDDDGFTPRQPQAVAQAPVYDGPSPEELIAQAEVEIENMRQTAISEIEQQKAYGYEEGKDAGYNEGRAMANAELAEQRAQLDTEREALRQQYEEMIDDLEPRFVHVLSSIYEKIFEVDLSGHRELIMGLLKNAMSHIEGSKNYLIHVSPEDHPYVMEHKEELITGSVTADAMIDIVEDVTMKKGDCMIETPDGIFDCSLDTELAALRKKLELLSYTPD